ncbi:MAG: hypothetical protein K2I03_09215 [Lachnospiraceae bacterium]|nr:hypothetical protein [Lachnospiraceae bacterium]
MKESKGEIMDVIELMEKIDKEIGLNNKRIPSYIHVDDISDSQVCIDGIWRNAPSSWGICWKEGKWVFFETDDERGYICGIKRCMTEEEVCEYVYEDLKCRVEADEENKPKDIACRYIQKEYGYTETDAKKVIQKIMEDKEVFEEFYNYLFSGKYCNEWWETIEVSEYSAERLVEKEGFAPVAAYRFLTELRENKDEAEKALRNGTVRKE